MIVGNDFIFLGLFEFSERNPRTVFLLVDQFIWHAAVRIRWISKVLVLDCTTAYRNKGTYGRLKAAAIKVCHAWQELFLTKIYPSLLIFSSPTRGRHARVTLGVLQKTNPVA